MNPAQIPMISPLMLAQAGKLPIKDQPVRFAVGDPNALTSNSWRVWVEKERELYIACRDNLREAKVSQTKTAEYALAIPPYALGRSKGAAAAVA